MKSRFIVALVAVAIGLSACASVRNSTSQNVSVNSGANSKWTLFGYHLGLKF